VRHRRSGTLPPKMDNELRDIGEACEVVAERVVEPVQGMHRVISSRTFRYLGPPGEPVRAVYEPVTDGIYRTIPRLVRVAGAGAAAALAQRAPEIEPVSRSRIGSGWQAAVNALWGDRLVERNNALAVSLTVRSGSQPVGVDRGSLAAAFPDATPHIAVLLHGLGQTERCWSGGSGDLSGVLGSLVETPGLTPVPVRYNTGLPVARTGDELSHLLSSIRRNWPVEHPVVSLVGYSMGGLVARRSWATAAASGEAWAEEARHLITIGAPHRGSPLARAAAAGAGILKLSRTSRPLGEFLDAQSVGMKNLRDGAGVAEMWGGAVSANSAGAAAGLREHVIAAVVTGDSSHPVGAVAGDLVVRVGSATAGTAHAANVRVLGRRRHFDLMRDPEVTAQVVGWLSDVDASD